MGSKPLKPVYEDFEALRRSNSVQFLKLSEENLIDGNKFSPFQMKFLFHHTGTQKKMQFMDDKRQLQHPKPITPAEKQEEAKPSEEVLKSETPVPQPQKPEAVPQKQNNGPEQAAKEAPTRPPWKTNKPGDCWGGKSANNCFSAGIR
ncbi:hypothetical protein DITRI_Ditri05aG0069600 [Diplodiscus trichospermus]